MKKLMEQLRVRSAAMGLEKRPKMLWITAAAALAVIMIAGISFLWTTGHSGHAAEDPHEDEHHEAIVTLAREAQKAAGIEVQEAMLQAFAAPSKQPPLSS